MDLEYGQIGAQAKNLSIFINSFAGKNEILYRAFYITEARAFQQVFWTYEAPMLEAMGLGRRLKGSNQLTVKIFNGNVEQNAGYSGVSFCFQVHLDRFTITKKTWFSPHVFVL